MTETLTALTAADAFVAIESIRVTDRHRKDLGDLQELAFSIRDVDLLNPITLTRDGRLVAGQRRLEACRLLGWARIPARFVHSLDDAAKALRAERDENVCRKDMLPSEKAALGEALLSIETEAAKARQRAAQDRGRATRHGVDGGAGSTIHTGSMTGKARDAVGEALGMSGRVYGDLRGAYQLATDPDAPEAERELARAALDRMDKGAGIQTAAETMRRELRARRDVEVTPAPEPEHKNGRTTKDAEERRARIRELAARGYSSHQIGEQIGMLPVTVRKNAREHDIPIPADRVMGRSPQRIDSNRIVRETVQAAEDLGMGLKLVDFDELDPAEIPNWTASLTESIRMLNRLNKRLKEMAQ